MVVSSAPGNWMRSSASKMALPSKLALPLRRLHIRKSLVSFLLSLRDSHFSMSKNDSQTPSSIVVFPCYKSGLAFAHFLIPHEEQHLVDPKQNYSAPGIDAPVLCKQPPLRLMEG